MTGGTWSIVRSLRVNWTFALAMAQRELKGSNKGAILGMAWLVLRPFVQVAAYVLIVSFIFGARLQPEGGRFDYAIYILAGLFGWQLLQRGLEDSTSLIRARIEVLKQVPYPIETLPVTSLLTTAIGPAVTLAVYILFAAIAGKLGWSILLLPLPLALLVMLLLGLSWMFMVVGVILKDLHDMIGLVLALAIYASPVILSESMVGPSLWRIILFNPLSHPVIAFRDVLQGGFHPESWAVFAVLATVSFIVGAWVVSRAKVVINEYI